MAGFEVNGGLMAGFEKKSENWHSICIYSEIGAQYLCVTIFSIVNAADF